MKIYIVMREGAGYDVTVEAVFLDEKRAKTHAQALNKLFLDYHYYVVGKEVKE